MKSSARPLDIGLVDSAMEAGRVAGMRAARAAGGGAPASPKLAEVTLNQTDSHPSLEWEGRDVWKISRVTYGSGEVEIRGVLGSMSIPRRAKSDTDGPKARCSGGSDQGRFKSSITRARQTLRNRCKQLCPDRMLTLTKRGKFESVDELWKAFKEFSRLMLVRFGEQWRYVACPELHGDGVTYHMHVAVRGFFWVDAVRAIWYRALGGKGNERGEDTPGGINISDPRKYEKRGGTRASRIRRLASYIAKYVGKGFDARNRGRRLFSSSSGLDPDRVERWRVREWDGTPQLVASLQNEFAASGGAGEGIAYFWSRHRADGRLLMTGFVLSTELRC